MPIPIQEKIQQQRVCLPIRIASCYSRSMRLFIISCMLSSLLGLFCFSSWGEEKSKDSVQAEKFANLVYCPTHFQQIERFAERLYRFEKRANEPVCRQRPYDKKISSSSGRYQVTIECHNKGQDYWEEVGVASGEVAKQGGRDPIDLFSAAMDSFFDVHGIPVVSTEEEGQLLCQQFAKKAEDGFFYTYSTTNSQLAEYEEMLQGQAQTAAGPIRYFSVHSKGAYIERRGRNKNSRFGFVPPGTKLEGGNAAPAQ